MDTNHPEQLLTTLPTSTPNSEILSLREAALLTKKAKRRKSSRRVGYPSAQLNFASGSNITLNDVPNGHAQIMVDSEDREEGEISDDDTLVNGLARYNGHEDRRSYRLERDTFQDIKEPLIEHTQGASPDPLDSQFSSVITGNILSMNEDQIWEAKNIILDLLGWGVSPAYLIDWGITHEILDFIFKELNLQFPSDLSTHSTPFHRYSTHQDDLINETVDIPIQTTKDDFSQNSEDEPPISVTSGPTLSELSNANHSSTRSSPQNDVANGRDDSQQQTTASTTTSSLLEIESQRRNELLTRKAVIASRKARMASDLEHMTATDVEKPSLKQTSSVDIELVDDFLQTITPMVEDSHQLTDMPRPSHDPLQTGMLPMRRTLSNISEEHTLPSMQPPKVLKRNGKRPVAADFVDALETDIDFNVENQLAVPPGTLNLSLGTFPTGRSSLASTTRLGIVNPNFINVGVAKHCVIDLSDSDSDQETPETVTPSSSLRINQNPISGTPSAHPTAAQQYLAKQQAIQRLKEKMEQHRSKSQAILISTLPEPQGENNNREHNVPLTNDAIGGDEHLSLDAIQEVNIDQASLTVLGREHAVASESSTFHSLSAEQSS